MAALRLSLLVMLLLNLLILAANAGWLGETSSRGEPERLTNQLYPERIMLLGDVQSYLAQHVPATAPIETPVDPATDAPASAPPPSPACMNYADVTDDIAQAIQSMTQDHEDLSIRKELHTPAEDWWVRIKPSPDRQSAEQRSEQLYGKGVRDLYIIREQGADLHAISLGLFRTEARALRHLEDMQALGVEGADVKPREPVRYAVQVTGFDATLDAVEERVRQLDPEANTSPCQ